MVNKLRLVENISEYYEYIRILRTHDENVSGFLEQVTITIQEQEKYMANFGKNYYICLLDDEPVGFVGEINGDIRVCTDPKHKKKGIGKFMINKLIELRPDTFAKVKNDNIPSINLFKSCKFKITEEKDNMIYFKP